VPSLIGRTAATDAVRVPLGGRNQIGRPLATRRGRPPWPSAVDVADGRGGEEVQNFQEKALHLLQHLLPLVARLSKSVIEFQG
jgi:hypothetical protein